MSEERPTPTQHPTSAGIRPPLRASGLRLFRQNRQALITVFGTNILLAIIGLVSGFVLARSLGPSGRGLLGSIQVLPTIVASFVMLGTQDAIVVWGIRQPQRQRALLKAALAMSLPVATVTVVALAAIPGGLVHRSWSHFTYLAVILIAPLTYLPHQILQATHRFAQWNLLRAATALAWLAIALITIVVPSTRTGSFVAMAYLVIQVCMVPIYMTVGIRSTPAGPPPTRADARVLLRFGLPVMLTAAPMAVNLRLDIVVVSSRFNLEQVGYYVAAIAWAGLLIPVFGTISTVTMPTIASKHLLRGNDEGSSVLFLAGAVVVGVCVLAIPVTDLLFPLVFGDKFRPATRLAGLALCAGAVQGGKDVAAATLRGRGHVRAPLIAESIALTITLGTLWPFLSHFGLPGGQWSSLIAYSASGLVMSWFVVRRPTSPSPGIDSDQFIAQRADTNINPG